MFIFENIQVIRTEIFSFLSRAANEFACKRLLLVGASYSAEDIALQCLKENVCSAEPSLIL